jgi:hypothetical protein
MLDRIAVGEGLFQAVQRIGHREESAEIGVRYDPQR